MTNRHDNKIIGDERTRSTVRWHDDDPKRTSPKRFACSKPLWFREEIQNVR